jgi:hypothetical protein
MSSLANTATTNTATATAKSVLAANFPHERDNNIEFYSQGHRYEIRTDPRKRYTSVTTLVHKQFPKFDADAIIGKIMRSKGWVPGHKYWGLTAEEIKELWNLNGAAAAGSGTNLHEQIELFMNDSRFNFVYTHKELLQEYNISKQYLEETQVPEFEQSPCVTAFMNQNQCKPYYIQQGIIQEQTPATEWDFFIQFIADHPHLKPYRTEWLIYHEDVKVAGSIDMVYENPDGTLEIYDWKRCKDIIKVNDWNETSTNPLLKHIPATNFWQYSLQLNLYKRILEDKYGKTVTKLCLVRLHPDNPEETYELLEVPFMTAEIDTILSLKSTL